MIYGQPLRDNEVTTRQLNYLLGLNEHKKLV